MIAAVLIVIAALVVNAIVSKIVVPIDDAVKVALFVLLAGLPIDVSMWLKIVLGFFHVKVIPSDGKESD